MRTDSSIYNKREQENVQNVVYELIILYSF